MIGFHFVHRRRTRFVSVTLFAKVFAKVFATVFAAWALTYTLASNAAARGEPAPVIDASAKPAPSELEARLENVERRLDSQSMMEMLSRLDRLQQEMQNIIGQMEVLNHEMDSIKKRQKDLYVDIDRRITQMEQKTAGLSQGQPVAPAMGDAGTAGAIGAATAATGGQPGAGAPVAMAAPVSPQSLQLQRDAYDRAFNLLKDGRYELAIASFKAYLETYPDADYADNAQYWLGEANYAQRQ